MALINKFKDISLSLGKNNHPVYAVMAIAICKGIFRPIFTMMDKEQDPESKRYAAFREGVTEAVAFPTYFIFGKLAEKIAPMFVDVSSIKDEKNQSLTLTKDRRTKFDKILNLDIDLKKSLKKAGKSHEEVAKEIELMTEKAINGLGNEEGLFKSYKKARSIVGETTSFIGVCIAAVFVIPATCNVVLPPIMKAFKKWQDSKKQDILPTTTTNFEKVMPKSNINSPNPNNELKKSDQMQVYLVSQRSSGMRVGN